MAKPLFTDFGKELAPDGLPWPEGYLDFPPRITLEEAIADSGVRPSYYWRGIPIYSDDDARNPNFRFPYPPEDEWVAEVEAEMAKDLRRGDSNSGDLKKSVE